MALSTTVVAVSMVYILQQVHTAAGGCPSIFHEFNMGCYHVGQEAVTSADQALATCTSLGGYLLNVDASLEYNRVRDMIKASPYQFDGYWIGAVFDTQNNAWMWQKTDNNGLLTTRYMNPEAGYYSWAQGEPGQQWPWLGEYRAAIMSSGVLEPWAWYSLEPSFTTPRGISYVCEADYKQ